MKSNEVEEIMKDVLNDFTNNPDYWKNLDETRKQKWVEHFMYGDFFIPLYPGYKDPFPQPPI